MGTACILKTKRFPGRETGKTGRLQCSFFTNKKALILSAGQVGSLETGEQERKPRYSRAQKKRLFDNFYSCSLHPGSNRRLTS